MRSSLVLAGLLLLSGCAALGGGRDRRAVLDTVQGFFDFIASGNAEVGARVMVPEGVFVTVREADGKRVVGSFSNAQSIERMRGSTQQMREAFVGNPLVLVAGDVATVWARYVFEVDGRHSHSGVDAFNLVRTDDGWKISGGAYSVIR
ncbi:MAG: hypothetical protein ACI89X_001586 [Planctomycetota bacterium]|jgi:hypothetical protein